MSLELSSTTACPVCGAATEGRWDFCRSCGTPLATDPTATLVADPTTQISSLAPGPVVVVPAKGSERRRQIRYLAVGVVLLYIGAVIGILVNDLSTHSDLSSTRGKLAATTSNLHAVQAALTTAQGQLTATKGQLTSTQSQLSSTQAELNGVQSTLTNTQSQLNLQSSQLSILKTCLTGIENSFVAELRGDNAAALAAIDSVKADCDSADKILNS